MTMLTVLGSGSRGNASALTEGDAVLLIDAGFSAREIARRAEQAGVSLDRLCGIALTHEHGDHAQGALQPSRYTPAAARYPLPKVSSMRAVAVITPAVQRMALPGT